MINLGLARITRLLGALGNPQNCYKALHVAGTNGKGSVVSYLSSVLTHSGHRTGRFTSPHLLSEEDAICINNQPVSKLTHSKTKQLVDALNERESIGATEFERQTAIAFEIFRNQNVEVAVVEVGLGGLEDATNVLDKSNVLCTAITKVALDHEGFLGSTLQEIAAHKAGIIKPGVPCVVDGTNDPQVLKVVKEVADRNSSLLLMPSGLPSGYEPRDILEGSFQQQNAAVAIHTLKVAYPQLSRGTIIEGLRSTTWPGRLQWIDVKDKRVLVDGAHNASAAIELANYAKEFLRPRGPITWVVAFSKPCDTILPELVLPQDNVIVTKFPEVAGMPWIQAQEPEDIAVVAKQLTENVTVVDSVKEVEFDDNSVVCGSLYLLGDLFAHDLTTLYEHTTPDI